MLQKCTAAKRQRKRGLERFFKSWMPGVLSKEIVLGHPCIPRVRVNKGGDKRTEPEKEGAELVRGKGGAGQIQGVKG